MYTAHPCIFLDMRGKGPHHQGASMLCRTCLEWESWDVVLLACNELTSPIQVLQQRAEKKK